MRLEIGDVSVTSIEDPVDKSLVSISLKVEQPDGRTEMEYDDLCQLIGGLDLVARYIVHMKNKNATSQ